jgi:hypothetical protein
MTLYDYIIIGGGISGLYANYKLLEKGYNCLLLEKNKHFGGRAYEINFHGSLIKLGAGIMADHNKHLIQLLNKLKIKINIFPSNISTYGMKDFNMDDAIYRISKKYKELKNKDIIKKLTMKQFLIKFFGASFAKEFILNCEYYDFVNSDIEYFIKYYDISDMDHESYNILIINWIDLINKLVKKNCMNNVEVKSIEKEDNYYLINDEYYAKKLVFTTTLKPLIKLSKNIININYKDYLGSVPFSRIYCYFKNGYKTNLPHFSIVNNKLQKIIKINDKILMASYSDSSNALYWNKISKLNKEKQKQIVSKYLKEFNINETIDDIIIAFWDDGVHYYKPTKNLDKTIKQLSHPEKNIYVVGEMISYKQGWVEGCIESVNRIFK